jgi:hypothetical protein
LPAFDQYLTGNGIGPMLVLKPLNLRVVVPLRAAARAGPSPSDALNLLRRGVTGLRVRGGEGAGGGLG